MKKLIIIGLIASSLQGCIFAVGAAAGAASVAAAYDHRTIEKTLDDQKIANVISNRINVMPGMDSNSSINVTAFNQVVLLTGQTPSADLRQKAEEIAKATPNVDKVYNQISVKGPASALTAASDSWITTKIRTQMLATKNLKSSSIKIITENGTVYLMGVLTHTQADIATDIARQTGGVQKVIRVFQYVADKNQQQTQSPSQ